MTVGRLSLGHPERHPSGRDIEVLVEAFNANADELDQLRDRVCKLETAIAETDEVRPNGRETAAVTFAASWQPQLAQTRRERDRARETAEMLAGALYRNVGDSYNLLTQGESPTQLRGPSAKRIYERSQEALAGFDAEQETW